MPKVIPLTSLQNPLIKKIRSLSERQARQKTGLFLIEGEKLLEEATSSGIKIDAVLVEKGYLASGEFRGTKQEEIYAVEASLLRSLATTTTPAPVLAVGQIAERKLSATLQAGRLSLLVGENIQDPGNLGTIIRSALAFGFDALLLTSGSVDIYNPKVVRGAMGALFRLPIITDQEIGELAFQLKAAAVEIISLSPEAGESLCQAKFSERTAFLVGNEGNGLTAEAEAISDRQVAIPTRAVESLNVAVAAAVAMWERAKRLDQVQ